jgi:ER lumen protein retaining receptor
MLESVAILPQLTVLKKYRLVENLTGKFMFFLGAYRLLYGLNWIVRSRTEGHYRHQPSMYICGIIQTLLYVNFYYQYCRISRLSRCCKEYRTRGDDDDDNDEMEELILESERELLPTRRSAEQSVLSNTDHDILLLDVSNNNGVAEDGTQRRQLTAESV